MKRCSILIKKSGLNVAELCISIFLLSSIIVMTIGILCGGLSAIKKGEDTFVVGNMLKAKLDYYSEKILYNFDDPNWLTPIPIPLDKISDGVNIKESWLSVSDIMVDPNADGRNKVKEVTVSIYWYDKNVSGKSELKKKSLSTCINNYLD